MICIGTILSGHQEVPCVVRCFLVVVQKLFHFQVRLLIVPDFEVLSKALSVVDERLVEIIYCEVVWNMTRVSALANKNGTLLGTVPFFYLLILSRGPGVICFTDRLPWSHCDLRLCLTYVFVRLNGSETRWRSDAKRMKCSMKLPQISRWVRSKDEDVTWTFNYVTTRDRRGSEYSDGNTDDFRHDIPVIPVIPEPQTNPTQLLEWREKTAHRLNAIGEDTDWWNK